MPLCVAACTCPKGYSGVYPFRDTFGYRIECIRDRRLAESFGLRPWESWAGFATAIAKNQLELQR